MKNLLYILSLVLIMLSIFIILELPESGRMALIAGTSAMAGFILNIVSFILIKNSEKETSKLQSKKAE